MITYRQVTAFTASGYSCETLTPSAWLKLCFQALFADEGWNAFATGSSKQPLKWSRNDNCEAIAIPAMDRLLDHYRENCLVGDIYSHLGTAIRFSLTY